MADFVTYQLKGTETLSARFRQFSQDMREKVARPAAKEAMGLVLDDAKDRALRIDDPETRNVIAKNIGMVERKDEGAELGAVIFSVGVRNTRARQRGGATFYWHMVELGTEHSRARPFLRPALSNNREAVFKAFIGAAKAELLTLGVS
ncbi:HK97-gp10 family putative phage morphogenesis protein [Pseudomonas urethralis]|uniref:HK97-gp10 family putative phage morphogenesis protein n=1 Tax=Pseudomonas urethralis TaxID=2740517 RepID=UPI001596C915|nr:HK97-gp10 family putative phage morphogenesis protein [Pseudomonas urethralis]